MNNYKKINNLFGWFTFAVALLVYWLTMEETASFWDCGEFIAVSYKLQVPHPPGAPFYLLLGRLFSFLSFGDVTKIAYWVNFLSVLSSAFTILFLFWTITFLARHLLRVKETTITATQTALVMGAGLVGALSYTFSDSFWSSAVEAEVYAMSSFFTALVVWMMLKWEAIEDEAYANRWLILIAYVIGLSIGVHLLNLLTLPALGLIYYFKKFKPTRWGVVLTFIISGGLVLFINNLIIPGLPKIAGKFEIFFVNSLGLFFGSGALFFSLLILGGLIYGIYYTHKKAKVVWNTFLLATAFILIGYTSYTTIIVRSNANTPINENAPKDVMSFIRYLEREQYGSRPLLYGAYYSANPIDYEIKEPIYAKGKDKYEVIENKFDYVYAPEDQTLLPRMWSRDHAKSYQSIMNFSGNQKPTFFENMKYMFVHQIGTMYARYFMWNFSSREFDSSSEQLAGWIRPQDWGKSMPEWIATNKGRNNYYMIPFILGLIGIFVHMVKDIKTFAITGLLFFMLGVAIVLYLNSPPVEPRERDYIYVGSYYAYAIWIGFAVIGIYEWLIKFIKKQTAAFTIALLVGMTSPVLMAAQGWDDHDRSNRFFSVDIASNFLNSCDQNGILFTGGDNDTFPLWYAQDVEGIRTDLRVIVLSYFNTDWYLEQTRMPSYESKPVQYFLTPEDYRQGGPNDYLSYEDLKIPAIDLKQYLDLLKQHNPQLMQEGKNILPSKQLVLKINKEEVLKKGIIPKDMDTLVTDQMVFKVKRGLEKKDLAFLDLLVTANWDRPIYLNSTSLSQLEIDMSPYVVQVGNVYRVLPIFNPSKQEVMDADRTYDLVMHQFKFRGLNDERTYNTEDYRSYALNHRATINDLAATLIEQNQLAKADTALLYSLRMMPDKTIPYDLSSVTTARLLFDVGEKEKATQMARLMGDRAISMAQYFMQQYGGFGRELQINLYTLDLLAETLQENGEATLAKKYADAYDGFVQTFQMNE